MKKNQNVQGPQLEQPEELHLIELNPNSLFMQLNRFVLGRFAPNPEMIVNYCPYFWLTIASFILLPVVGLVKLTARLILLIFILPLEKLFFESIEKEAKNRTRLLFSDGDLPWYVNDCRYFKFRDEWIEKEAKRRGMTCEQILEEIRKKREDLDILKRRKEESKKKMSWKMPNFEFPKKLADYIDGSISNFMEKIRDTIAAQKMLIKFAQRFVGLLITAVFGVITYFLMNLLSRGILWSINIWGWPKILEGILYILASIAIICILVLVIWVLGRLFYWLEKVIPSDNFVFRALKVGIVVPLYYLFVVFIWKLIIVSFIWIIILKFLVGGSVLFIINGIVGIGPLFKKYFGQEYTGLCPGIKWVEKTKKA